MSYHQAAHHRAKCYHSLVGVGLGEAQKEILPDHFLKLLREIDLLSIPASNLEFLLDVYLFVYLLGPQCTP